VKLRFIVVAIFWFVWRSAPGVFTCAGYWLSIFSVLEIALRSRKMSEPEAIFLFSGVLSNAVVTVGNGGIMPVIGMPSSIVPAAGIWSASGAGSHWLILADNARLWFYSVGDILLFIGIIMFSVRKLKLAYRRFYRVQNVLEG
jgi:hypothetical protein